MRVIIRISCRKKEIGIERSDELKRFEADVTGSEELRQKLDEAIKRIFEEKQAESDCEALAKAAAELGYDLNVGELERAQAEMQTLSDEELETVAGGYHEDKWCMGDYYCFSVVSHDAAEGEEGRTLRACWHDYECIVSPNGRVYPCMAFSDSALAESFPSALEQPLGDITLSGAYHDTVETKIADLLARNPECAACEHLPRCLGGCLVESMTDEGDYLVPDERCCYFHKSIRADAVREVADAAIAMLG